MDIKPQVSEGSLLDLLIVVAVNIKLLLLGPIVVGLLTFAASYALPQKFTSQSLLLLPTPTPTQTQTQTQTATQAAAIMLSPLVLDAVIESQNLSGGHPIEVVRMELAGQIKATVGKEGLLRLDVTADAPLQAQSIANAVINIWIKSTVPSEQVRVSLEKRLDYVKGTLESLNRLLERLGVEGAAALNKPLTRGEAGTSIVALGELQARYFEEALTIPRSLQGLSRDVVKQSPTLPTEPVSPKKSLIAFLAAMGTCLLLLVWVFIHQAWKNAALDPDVAEKKAQLRAALRLKDPLQ